jgi:ribonuclease D
MGYNVDDIMTQEKTSAPALITEPDALADLVEVLSQESLLAVDTESNSLYAYQEQVCLIQFSTQVVDYLVDPLSLDDLSPLATIFANPEIEKIFHAAEYDLICLKRDFDFKVLNLFDTMIAASVLGKAEVGLGSILKNEFGVQMDKRYQRANWGQRPLPDHLLDYARLDTRYLIKLRNRLKVELEESGRWPMASEDFHRLSILNGGNHENSRNHARNSGEACWRISGANDLSPQQAAVLLELCKYRDRMAKNMNRPLFKVISDSTLHAIASACPVSVNELKRLPGMSRGQVYQHGSALLQAVKLGLEAQPVTPPRPPRPDEKFLCRLENLRQWRMRTARDLGVKSDVILSRDLLYAVAERNPRKMDELAEILKDAPWRLKNYGEQIIQTIHCP